MRRTLALLTIAAVACVGSIAVSSPATAAQTIGFPTFNGPAIPQPPVGYSTGNMMRTIYDAEAAGGGTDFWMDRLLSRTGSDPAGNWLMSRGRAVFMKTHTPGTLGFAGQVAYWESISNQSAYTVAITPGTFSEQVSQRRQTPSNWRSVHTSGSISVTQTKFITEQNVAVTNLAITNNGTAAQTLQVRGTSPYATSGSGSELVGTRATFNSLTNLTIRLSGDQFAISSGGLNRSVTVNAGQTVSVKLQMGFTATEIPESLTEYNAYRAMTPATAFSTHVRAYNLWWAENIPYIDVPELPIKKEIYYRWWLMRFNFLDANIPGQTFQFPTSMEGVLGYNNAIVLTQPMHVDDLKYLRNPVYSYGPWLSVGQVSGNGRFMDNPGDPANWSNSYTQYLGEAAWKSYQIHGGQAGIVRNLARYAEQDVRGQLAFYDHDGNDIIEYDWGALTGNDADAVSFHWRSGWLDRTEGAYQYSGARAAAQAYALLGNTAKANELNVIATDIQNAIVNTLWNPSRQLLEHRHVATNAFVPWKEINNYYPYSVGLMPNTATFRQALRLYDDPADYPIFPFFTANQRDKAEAAGQGVPGSNNFSTINSTVQFRLYSSVLRNYPNQWMTNEHYKQLLYWNAWAQYVNGNTAFPDANEFWFNWNPSTRTINGRSGIHHNILGSSNWTVIEDVAGLRPRTDQQVELWPIDIDWSHFAINNLRYRNADLSIVWDDPADGVTRYPGVPQGYSIFVNGTRTMTVDNLVHLVWNPANGSVSFPGQTANVLFNTSAPGMQAPIQVQHTSGRMVDMLADAGVDLSANLTNLATGATATASATASGTSTAAAIDGFTINNPIWGTAGASGTTAWYQLSFPQQRTFDEVRLYFRDSRPGSATYRAPSSYEVQVMSGGNWVTVSGQVKSPTAPVGNYNLVRFPAVSAQQMRVLVTHAGSARTGLTEIQVYQRGDGPPPSPDNLALSASASCSFTSAWESCAAVNSGDEPASSNIPGPNQGTRWGTWPQTGSHWIQLTWPSPVTVDSSQMFFFQDSTDGSNSGVKRPGSWSIEFWNGSAWVPVSSPSGYPTALDQYNQTTFTPVTTSQLRAVLQTRTDAAAVGALEWKVS
jgi:mannosylglycerate hydrolase MGH1-like protein/F5/8 type C domain-containing protein